MVGVVIHTASEEVIRNTPPSSFALKVGAASRRRWRSPLTFTAQHYIIPHVKARGHGVYQKRERQLGTHLIPVFFCHGVQVAERCEFGLVSGKLKSADVP